MYSQVGKGQGGAEAVFEDVANGLEQRDIDVCRVYSDYSIPAGVIRDGDNARFIALGMPPTWKSFFRPTYTYRFFASLIGAYRLLWHVQPDVVNIHFFMTSSLHFALLKALFDYRLVISCHGSDTIGFRGMKKRVSPFILERADVITCVSKAVVDQLKNEVPGTYDTKVIYNGIDIDFWSDEDQDSEKIAGRVVSVGALKEVKGHDVLIRAFRKVVDGTPDASLQIVGDGPERERYESLINDLGLSQHVTITGWLSKEEVRDKLHRASLFVLPSRNEGFGLALVEAMAVGMPVVASNVGGITEVTEGTGARLVTPDNEDELAESLIAALKDTKWRQNATQEGIERVQALSHSATVDQYKSALA